MDSLENDTLDKSKIDEMLERKDLFEGKTIEELKQLREQILMGTSELIQTEEENNDKVM